LLANREKVIQGTGNLGGPIITAGGLIFIRPGMDNYLRAVDIDTAAGLWKGRFAEGDQAMPMTYRLPNGGQQFVVIDAGRHARRGPVLGDSFVAFSLP